MSKKESNGNGNGNGKGNEKVYINGKEHEIDVSSRYVGGHSENFVQVSPNAFYSLRRAVGMNRRKFAKRCDVSVDTIDRVEDYGGAITRKTLSKILATFDLPHDLLTSDPTIQILDILREAVIGYRMGTRDDLDIKDIIFIGDKLGSFHLNTDVDEPQTEFEKQMRGFVSKQVRIDLDGNGYHGNEDLP